MLKLTATAMKRRKGVAGDIVWRGRGGRGRVGGGGGRGGGLVPARGEKRGPVDFHRSQNSNLGGERSPTVCLA